MRPAVALNGEQVGTPVPDGFFFVDRPAGEYVVSTSTEVESKMPFELARQEQKYVRFEVTMGVLVGHVTPVLVDGSHALAEMRDMHYVGVELGK